MNGDEGNQRAFKLQGPALSLPFCLFAFLFLSLPFSSGLSGLSCLFVSYLLGMDVLALSYDCLALLLTYPLALIPSQDETKKDKKRLDKKRQDKDKPKKRQGVIR
jgi:hypothetical protein